MLDARYLKSLTLKQDLPVRIELLGDAPVTASVDFIDSRIDPASGLVEVKLLAENSDQRIKAGMRAYLGLPDLAGAK